MKLNSKYFSFREMTRTSTGLLNIPSAVQLENIQKLVTNVLDPLRELYGKPIIVNSGFRSVLVNKAVKGASNSDHLHGYAADLDSEDNALIYKLIKDNFEFRQLIWEKGNDKQPDWVHVSFNDKDNKKQTLRIK